MVMEFTFDGCHREKPGSGSGLTPAKFLYVGNYFQRKS